jgi:hypothetical protein
LSERNGNASACHRLGWGRFEVLEGRARSSHTDWNGGTVVALHKFAGRSASATIRDDDNWEELVDLFGREGCRPGSRIKPKAYDFRWLRPHVSGESVTG